MKGLLIVISGPSGAGKSTVTQELLKRNPEYFLSVSATTRKIREGETDGVHYHFMTEENFLEKVREDGFLENANFCGNYYGTPKDKVLEKLDLGINVVLEIEVQGAMQVKEKYPEGVFVFILPPSLQELRKRLEGRKTDDPEIIEKRLRVSKYEIGFAENYDYIVINENIKKTTEIVENIIISEMHKAKRTINFLKERFI